MLQVDLNASNANSLIEKAVKIMAVEEMQAMLPTVKEDLLRAVKSQMST